MRGLSSVLVLLVIIDSCQVWAACPYDFPGDLDGSCTVDFNDFAILAAEWEQGIDGWVASYDGPAGGSDQAKAITIDSKDNIYVTGLSYGIGTFSDFCTIKYSADSSEPVWVSRYNGPTNLWDGATAIAVDSKDNIYVTGASYAPITGADFCTVKYSGDSNEPIWVARYCPPGTTSPNAWAIAIDSKDNIYVTGGSYGSSIGTHLDYVTIKYAPDSNEPVWVATYTGPDNQEDDAQAIAIDSNDNIYVTGYSTGSGTGKDCVTIKYSADSNQPVWVARYTGPGNADDGAYAIAADSNDYIYVTGYSTRPGTAKDCVTIKYSPDNNTPVWVAAYNGPGNGDDEALAVAIDSNDNIYVTGYGTVSGTSSDFVTIKYSPDSNQSVWVATYTGSYDAYDRADAIAVDSKDNIYVAGHYSFWYLGHYDFATIKYRPDSNEPVWLCKYHGPGDSRAYAVATDSADNIFVTGLVNTAPEDTDYVTIKYSSTCTSGFEGDIDADCRVGITDLALLCGDWLESSL